MSDSVSASGASASASSKQATIRFGVYNQPGGYAGKTIGDVKRQFGELWNMPADVVIQKGKTVIEDSYVIQAGDTIDFVKRMGEKGNK